MLLHVALFLSTHLGSSPDPLVSGFQCVAPLLGMQLSMCTACVQRLANFRHFRHFLSIFLKVNCDDGDDVRLPSQILENVLSDAMDLKHVRPFNSK